MATYGSGKPVIAFVGEFDALPGLSQDAVPEKKALSRRRARPRLRAQPARHCLDGGGDRGEGVAGVEQAAPGTVRFYGTPAEEGGGAKGYMVRDGLFDDVDVAVSWHPGDAQRREFDDRTSRSSPARFRFHGIAAHAAAAPDKGRSALDAVEAMNHMVDMMREHVPTDSRIHYVISKGGSAP